jgi:N-glycosylase/DNA lyase
MSTEVWTSWKPLRLAADVPADSLPEQLDGGQCFRWSRDEAEIWTGVFGDTVASLRSGCTGLEWRAPSHDVKAEAALRYYLDAEGVQAGLAEALPWRSDAVLHGAMKACPGLRILRQDPHEALLGFLCSSNKRILQIRTMVAAMAVKMGKPLAGGFHSLPTWGALLKADDALLRSCALGYRASFIRGTAEKLAARPDWASEFAALPTPALMAELQSLPGVGPKVASCVALFGFGRLESFPVDTWVVQALGSAYGLLGWKPAQLEEFGRLHFGAGAGLAQQFLFSAARLGQLPEAPRRIVPPKVKRSRSRG